MATLPSPRTASPSVGASRSEGLRGPQLWWRVDAGRPVRLVVLGEIDAATEDEFERAIASAAGAHELLIVDLTGVTFLGGGAIHILERHLHNLVGVLVAADRCAARALRSAGFPCVVAMELDESRQSR